MDYPANDALLDDLKELVTDKDTPKQKSQSPWAAADRKKAVQPTIDIKGTLLLDNYACFRERV
jgi:hypothetical protein